MVWPFSPGPQPLGARGEAIALRHLKRAGMKLLADNYRCPSGEIDLIVLDPTTRKATGAETIVFVEVKTRSCDRYTRPESAVDAEKEDHIRRAASYYLRHHDTEGYRVRYDVVGIVMRGDGSKPEVTHIRDAF